MVTSSAIPYSDYPCTSKSGSNVSEKEHWLVTVDMKRSEEAFKKQIWQMIQILYKTIRGVIGFGHMKVKDNADRSN